MFAKIALTALTILTVAGSERTGFVGASSPHPTSRPKFIRWDPIATIPTHGASGWEYFRVPNAHDNSHTHYLAVSNFMSTRPSADGSPPTVVVMEAESVLYELNVQREYSGDQDTKQEGNIQLNYKEVQRFATNGAHGVDHLSVLTVNDAGDPIDTVFLVIPNFYGTDTVIYQYQRNNNVSGFQRNIFREHQRIDTQGAAAVEFFTIKTTDCADTADAPTSCPLRNMLAIAEFHSNKVSIYEYVSNEWVLHQRLYAPGTAALSVMTIPSKMDNAAHPEHDSDDQRNEDDEISQSDKVILLTASYNVQGEWNTQSQLFVYDHEESVFVLAQLLPTVGAHGIATLSTPEGRHFCFVVHDKNSTSTLQRSALYEYRPIPVQGQQYDIYGVPLQDFEFVLRQEIETDGAHGATFVSVDGMHYLVVAEFGDRVTQRYTRSSRVHRLDLGSLLVPLAELPTEGATDFETFSVDGDTFVVVSNEQNESEGIDIGSTVWRIVSRSDDEHDDGQDNIVSSSESMRQQQSRPDLKDEL